MDGAASPPGTPFARRTAAVVALLAAGILAGTQLGKIAPLVPWYRDTLGFSLVMTGWLVAAMGSFVALLSVPAGWAIERFGLRRSYAASVVVMIAGGAMVAAATRPDWVMLARLVEGAGYLVLVIVIPALLNVIPTPGWRGPALAIWGGFVPVGFAIADFGARWLEAAAHPQLFLGVCAAAFALVGVASVGLAASVPDAGGPTFGTAETPKVRGRVVETLTVPVMLIALAFGLYVVLSVGFFAFLPTYVAHPEARIGLSAGAIALTVPIGNLIAGAAIRAGGSSAPAHLALIGFAVSMAAAVPAFGGGGLATLACIVLSVAGGMIASALFAAIPATVARSGSAAIAIGLVCQSGGIGTVVGPPLAARIIETLGFAGYGVFLLATSAAGAAAVLGLHWRAARR